MFFFSFFEQIYNKPAVQRAFKKVCLNKMLFDGYFDMSMYIYARMKKEDILAALIRCKSSYVVLYKNAYPKKDNIVDLWERYFGNGLSDHANSVNAIELTDIEAEAIVNWVYQACNNAQEREQFTIEIFQYIKGLHSIKNDIIFTHGVVYNKKKVSVYFISSLEDMNSMIASYQVMGKQLFFRGHTNPNYTLQPAIFRSKSWQRNERAMYNELLINCPDDFTMCRTHLEKLVKMQHYGLPTRLLDITRNPLVALYFACENGFDCFGEVILISAAIQDIKYPQSDTVSILASLPQFTYDKQMEFYHLITDPTVDDETFNGRVPRLLHEIRLEKPAFQAEIQKKDLLRNVIVYALKNNNRIVKQDGAFILCGLQSGDKNSLNQIRYKESGKTAVLLIDKKKQIREQLNTFSINRATLFPEIECVSEYIRNECIPK